MTARRLGAALLGVALALALAGCDGAVPGPGRSDVDVDTPQLRSMKADAGIDTCVPGPGGGELPRLTLPCLGGGPDVDLSALKGPMLINLWNSGCGPCRKEMPAIEEFYRAHGDRVQVLGIDQEIYPDAALAFARHAGATYPQVADPGGEIFEQSGLKLTPAFPQFIVLAADGSVAGVVAGGLDSAAEVRELVEDELGVSL